MKTSTLQLILYLTVCFVNKLTIAQNVCVTDKVEITVIPWVFWPDLDQNYVNGVTRDILNFRCYSGTSFNPTIPIDNGSKESEYNELILSPNLYNIVPVDALCPFINIYLLDLSKNAITSTTGAFKILSCLRSIQRFDISDNLISTPLLASDFDDLFPAHLQIFNLKNNRIPSIDTNVFFKSDGTSRFPKLYLLDLSGNKIKVLDLLWPMSIPHPYLNVKLASNPINTIKNQLLKSYQDSVYIAINGTRTVDVTNSDLTSLSDSALLQYLPNSADGFKALLAKIANFDFSQTTNKLSCDCPAATGLYTVYWYGTIQSSIANKSAPIYKLTCANINNTYIFSFPCQFIGTSSTSSTTSTTTTSTTITSPSTTTTTSTTTTPTTSNQATNSFEQQVVDTTTISPTSASSGSNNDLYLLFLLLIPLVLLVFILFVCCFGRWCSTWCFDSCSVKCCSCFRPDENKDALTAGKSYDLSVCHSETDERWVEEKFLPQFSDYSRGYKIHKLKMNNGANLDKEQVEILRSSKRIIIVFTKNFVNNEWSNQEFRSLIKDITVNDPYCVVVPVNVGEVTQEEVDKYMKELTDDGEKKNAVQKARAKLQQNIRHNCGLKDVESLNWQKDSFWKKLSYIMPFVKNKEKPTEITGSSKYKKLLTKEADSPRAKPAPKPTPIPKIETSQTSLRSEHKDIFISNENELPLITSLTKSIEESKRATKEKGVDAKRIFPVNEPDSARSKIGDTSARDNLWITVPIGESDTYEPIGTAGSSTKGNKEAYLNRFGIVPNVNPLYESNRTRISSAHQNSINRVSKLNLDKINDSETENNSSRMGDSGRRIIVPASMLTKLGPRRTSFTNEANNDDVRAVNEESVPERRNSTILTVRNDYYVDENAELKEKPEDRKQSKSTLESIVSKNSKSSKSTNEFEVKVQKRVTIMADSPTNKRYSILEKITTETMNEDGEKKKKKKHKHKHKKEKKEKKEREQNEQNED